MKFAPGVGLPGNVWMAGRPIWSADITTDPQFVHLRDLPSLRAAVAFPIAVRGEIRAVERVAQVIAREEDRVVSVRRVRSQLPKRRRPDPRM